MIKGSKIDWLKISGYAIIIGFVIVMLYTISHLQETPPIETPPIATETPLPVYPCVEGDKCA